MKSHKIFLILTVFLLVSACNNSKKKEEPAAVPEPSKVTDIVKPKYLYVSTGLCYSGTGNTTFTTATASNLVYRLNLSSGQKDMTFADYNASTTPGESPTSVVEFDKDNLLVTVEITAGGSRRVQKIPKSSNPIRSDFSSNTTALSAALKFIFKTADNGFLVSKTSGVEKFTNIGIRMGAPYIGTNLGATCGAANANITSIATSPSNKIFYTNAAASNNRWGVISPNGYTVAADCLAAQAAPNANAYPVAINYLAANNQVMVAYAGNAITTDLNSIYVYDFDDTTNAISNPTKIYDANTYVAAGYLLYGISAMAFDSADNSLYVATAVSTATTVVNYVIEKLSYNPSTKALTRVGTVPFYNYGVDTKCISSLMIAE